MKKQKRKDKKPIKHTKAVKKQKARRLWGLEVRTFSRANQQYMDWDQQMLNDLKLDPEAAQWYSKFIEESYGNTLNKDFRKNLHYKHHKKEIYDATNARNRDLYNQRYRMNDTDHLIMDSFDNEYLSPEDAIIEMMDKRDKIKEFIMKAYKANTEKIFTGKLVNVVFDVHD